jgi:hypothetical protein
MSNSQLILNKMDQRIQEWKSCQDSRYVFLSCYKMMSANMLVALSKNEFHDSVWVGKLLNRFADYYFDGLSCFECGDQTPEVWLAAHNATLEKELSELQMLVLGVNAHINYDLVLALYDMLAPEWESLTEEQRKMRYEDHCYVNNIIARTIDAVQDRILEPENRFLAFIDVVFGRVDEYLISQLISSWREDVWKNTQVMMQVSNDFERETFRKKIETEVLELGDTICSV